MLMLKMKKITYLIILFLVFGVNGFAQTNQKVSDGELENFASALKQVQVINQTSQEEMVSAVENEDLTVQRYNEIHQASVDPEKESDASESELKNYQKASSEIEKIQTVAQQKMEEKIEEEDLTVIRYQEIANAVQSDPSLQQKLQEFF